MATEILAWSGLLRCFTQLSSFTLLAVTEMFRCAGALRLDNLKVFRCPGRNVSLVFFFFFLWISATLDCWNACFCSRRQQLCVVCVEACIIASSMWKLRKCLTLFYMWARHVLWALRLKSIKLSLKRQQTFVFALYSLHDMTLSFLSEI